MGDHYRNLLYHNNSADHNDNDGNGDRNRDGNVNSNRDGDGNADAVVHDHSANYHHHYSTDHNHSYNDVYDSGTHSHNNNSHPDDLSPDDSYFREHSSHNRVQHVHLHDGLIVHDQCFADDNRHGDWHDNNHRYSDYH